MILGSESGNIALHKNREGGPKKTVKVTLPDSHHNGGKDLQEHDGVAQP